MPRSVGILTFHQADNHGAVLQAYGLAQAIRELGHRVEIIDYRPAVARRFYRRFGIRSGKCVSVLTRRWRFHRFRRKYLPLSRRQYLDWKSLEVHPPDVDCIICGSDQIWNVSSLRGYDPAFFLKFAGHLNVRKASYAATFGGATDFASNREEIAELLKQFDRISVRDADSQETVNGLIGRAPARVVDPSLLVDYAPITPPPIYPTPYIAVYCLERTQHFRRVATALQHRLQLPLISVGAHLEGAQMCATAGPRQWLSVLKHAQFVLTNSFHGLCFAIKDRKDFLVVPHSKAQVRLDDLLAWFGLANRVVTDHECVAAMTPDQLRVDYSPVGTLIEGAIEHSRDYLREVLYG